MPTLLPLSLPLTLRRAASLVLACGLLSGCASDPDRHPEDQAEVQKLIMSAYHAEQSYPTRDSSMQWQIGEQSQEILWTRPDTRDPVPLIVYMPGLGESAHAGDIWRQGWAKAGYAVLSVQPPAYDRSIYTSPQALAGNFPGLAHDKFSQASLALRLALIDRVVAQVRQRNGSTELGALKLDRIAVAGFDLGAQTAAGLAGERNESLPAPQGWRPSAALLFSPYVEPGTEARLFAKVDTPVLAITSNLDEDPFNVVKSASSRQALWQHLSVSGSYQLLLNEAMHTALSGSTPDTRAKEESSGSFQPSGRSGGGGGGGGGRMGGGGRGMRGAGSSATGGGGVGRPEIPRLSPKQTAAIQAISIAFLDATLKQDPVAAEWLSRNAPHWLGSSGSLASKPGL